MVNNLPNAPSPSPTDRSWYDPVVGAILLVALALRLYLAIWSPLLDDESKTYIPNAKAISLRPGQIHLPIRESQHPALPCYIARAGALLAGDGNFAFRLGSLVLGMATIVLVYRAALLWDGRATARWAALLLAVNEYHIAASSLAVELGPQLFFVALAVYAGLRFFADERPRWLYLAAAACGLGFLCREVICLLLPIWFLTVLMFPQRRWLLRKEPWLAAGLFLLLISPDVICTLIRPLPEQHRYATYLDHFSRFAGLGFNEYPTWFYLRDLLRIAGRPFTADFNDMPTMNLLSGGLLLLGGFMTLLRRRGECASMFLALAFWGIYGLFTLMLLGTPRRDDVSLDERVFHTVDVTLVPGVLMAGAMLARLAGRWQRIAACVGAVLLVAYVVYRLGHVWP